MAAKKPKIEMTDISQVTADAENVRRRDDRAKATIKTSIDTFGPARSIVIDANNVVRAGNGTLEQAAASGIKRLAIIDADPDTLVAVRRKDWSGDDAKAYAIADNRAGDLSTFDYEAVHEQLAALADAGRDDLVEAAGFELGELEKIMGETPDADEADAAGPETDREIPSLYSVVIECQDEDEQRAVYDAAMADGKKCRLLVV